jgi:hypothetical protein
MHINFYFWHSIKSPVKWLEYFNLWRFRKYVNTGIYETNITQQLQDEEYFPPLR